MMAGGKGTRCNRCKSTRVYWEKVGVKPEGGIKWEMRDRSTRGKHLCMGAGEEHTFELEMPGLPEMPSVSVPELAEGMLEETPKATGTTQTMMLMALVEAVNLRLNKLEHIGEIPTK